jgi:hypothetical protein
MPFDLDESTAHEPTREANEILNAMPEPQQHAIDAAAAEEIHVESDTQTGDADSAGEVWNPAVHSTGADGKGIKTAKGTWRRRRGAGTAPRSSKVYKPADNAAAEAAQKAQEVAAASARAAGCAIASSVFMIGRAFGGETWKPTPDEVSANNDAWTAYCLAKGIHDFPPGLAVCICTLGYAGPRLFTPETKQRAGTIKQWFMVRIAKRRVKKELKKRGILANVTIQGTAGADPYDSILVDGKPFKEMPKEKTRA